MNMAEEILRVENLHVSVEDTPILNGMDLTINRGEIHVIMGRNGAGKSTLASVIMGHPAYEITEGSIHYMGTNIDEMSVFERARAGMFLSFQYPAVIPGVQVGTFLKKSVQSVRDEPLKGREFRKELNGAMATPRCRNPCSLATSMTASAAARRSDWKSCKCCCSNRRWPLDETDSGLDIDALRIVAKGINSVAPKPAASSSRTTSDCWITSNPTLSMS